LKSSSMSNSGTHTYLWEWSKARIKCKMNLMLFCRWFRFKFACHLLVAKILTNFSPFFFFLQSRTITHNVTCLSLGLNQAPTYYIDYYFWLIFISLANPKNNNPVPIIHKKKIQKICAKVNQISRKKILELPQLPQIEFPRRLPKIYFSL
jgi:hypothetical protein